MRKKTIKNLCDNVMWSIIYLAPLILTALLALGAWNGDWFATWIDFSGDFLDLPWNSTLYGLLNAWGFTDSGIVYNALKSLFGQGGVLPLIVDRAMLIYMSYFVTMVLVHLAVDFLLFIPRIAHKFMNAFTKED